MKTGLLIVAVTGFIAICILAAVVWWVCAVVNGFRGGESK